MMKLCIAWKLQPIPLVAVDESFGAGAGRAVLSGLLLLNKEEWI